MNIQRLKSVQELFTCPVCMDWLKQPTMLTCGHCFCHACLQSWITKGEQYSGITCPSCRQITIPKLQNLTKPVLVEQLQEKITQLQEAEYLSSRGADVTKCTVCLDSLSTADDEQTGYYCLQCCYQLCRKCCQSHCQNNLFAGHQTMRLNPETFCSDHVTEPYIGYCEKCQVCVCKLCASTRHSTHNMTPISVAAHTGRQQLYKFIEVSEKGPCYGMRLYLKERYMQAIQTCTNFKKMALEVKELMRKFYEKLETIEEKLEPQLLTQGRYIVNLDQQMSALNSHSSGDATASARSLLLQDNDIKVVKKMEKFMAKSLDSKSVDFPLTLPVIDDNLEVFKSALEKAIDDVDVTYTKETWNEEKLAECLRNSDERTNDGDVRDFSMDDFIMQLENTPRQSKPNADLITTSQGHPDLSEVVTSDQGSEVIHAALIHSPPTPNLEEAWSLTLTHWAHSITLGTGNRHKRSWDTSTHGNQLVVRTEDPESPLRMYTQGGELLSWLGCGRSAHGLGGIGRMAVDSHRHVFVAACGSTLLRLDPYGNPRDCITLPGKLRGVAYSPSTDSYVISDVTKNRLVVIHAKTKKIFRQFCSRGPGDTHFLSPSYIHISETASGPHIIVSDGDNDCVKVLDMAGNLIHTYGSSGESLGHLSDPRGVCTDKAGRILVCDYKNRRVVACWTDKAGTERWEILVITGTTDSDAPYDITMDHTTNSVVLLCGKYKSKLKMFKLRRSNGNKLNCKV